MIRPVNNWMATLALLTALLGAPAAMAQQDVQEVSTELLTEFPHRFWAKRVIFRDKLTSEPSSSREKIKGNYYFEITTEALGSVYLTEEAREHLDTEDSLNREYMFRGTVLNKGSLIGKDRFFFIVEAVIQNIDPTADIEDRVAELVESPAGESEQQVHRVMGELLYAVQSAALLYTSEQGVSFKEIFDENSVHHEKLMDITRSVMRPVEREGQMPPTEILGQLIISALMDHYGTSAPEKLPLPSKGFSPVETKTAPPVLEDFLPSTPSSLESSGAEDTEMDMDDSMDELAPDETPDQPTAAPREEMTKDIDTPSPALGVMDTPPEEVDQPIEVSAPSTEGPALHKNTRELLKSLEDDSLVEPEPLELDLDFDF